MKKTRQTTKMYELRDKSLYADHKAGMSYDELSQKYFVTRGNAQVIVCVQKKLDKPVQEKIELPAKREYRVIEADTIEELVRGVNEMTEQGYTPVGSITNVSTMSRHYVQAIMK